MSEYKGAAARLEYAVINMKPEEIGALYKKIGYVEFSAKALGLACRFRGIETVRALAECGATFDIPQKTETEERYRVYSGVKYENYRSDFSLYLLNIFKKIPGACCCNGLKFIKYAPVEKGKKLGMISDAERAEVLEFLCENAEKLSFNPSELLLFAIYSRDGFIYEELKKRGVKLSEKRIGTMANGGPMSEMYWFEYCSLTAKMADADYLPVMEMLAAELGGKRFYCTEKIFEITERRFSEPGIAEFFFENFDSAKLNKLNILRGTIDSGNTSVLALAEKAGWLANIKRRDELIEYSRKNDRVECTAWLLDFKNRTADLAAEQAKAEKKMERELNASPNSVMMLKKIWGYKKMDEDQMKEDWFRVIDGLSETLVITNYKGSAAEVTVPERIGKSIVTAIGNGAFAGAAGIGAGAVRPTASAEQMNLRMDYIKSITLPDTVKYIGVGAFVMLRMLKTINIPEGVEEIDNFAFSRCYELEEIVIPGSVRRIGEHAFSHCAMLRRVIIREGVELIEAGAFADDQSLEYVELPASVERMPDDKLRYNTVEAFTNSKIKLTVRCPAGSFAENYCKEHKISMTK